MNDEHMIAIELRFTKTKITFFYMRHNVSYKANVIDVNRLLQKNLKTKSIFHCKLKHRTDKNRIFFDLLLDSAFVIAELRHSYEDVP